METFKIKGAFIPLNQLLKLVGWFASAGEANAAIESGSVEVNGLTELRKRNKIKPGSTVKFNGIQVQVE